MKFISKDVDRRLIILIILFLALFIAFTIYSHAALTSILKTKNVYDKSVAQFTAEIVLNQLNKTNKSLEVAMIDKTVLENKLNDALGENEQLQDRLREYSDQVLLLKSQLEYYNLKSQGGPSESFRAYYTKLEEVRNLKGQIKSLCNTIKSINLTAKECYDS